MSTVNVSLPREEKSPPVRPFRILLVNEDGAELVRHGESLREEGCTVHSCSSHLKALARLEHGTFDLVVVNQGKDRFGWRCVVDRASTLKRRTPSLVLTWSYDMVCYLEAIELGALDYLEKPLTGAQLLSVFESSLQPRNPGMNSSYPHSAMILEKIRAAS